MTDATFTTIYTSHLIAGTPSLFTDENKTELRAGIVKKTTVKLFHSPMRN